jgi:hypothetical protein
VPGTTCGNLRDPQQQQQRRRQQQLSSGRLQLEPQQVVLLAAGRGSSSSSTIKLATGMAAALARQQLLRLVTGSRTHSSRRL